MGKKTTEQDTAEPQGEGLAPGAEASQASGPDAAAADIAASAGGDVTPPELSGPIIPMSEAAIRQLVGQQVQEVLGENLVGFLQAEVKAYLDANLEELVKAAMTQTIEAGPVSDAVRVYLEPILPDLVKAAMPPTPEQQAQQARESFEETVRREQAAAARRAKREAAEAEKLATAAAEAQAKRDADAAKAFADRTAFVGTIADLSAKIVREIRIDDGQAYSAELRFPVEFGEFEPTNDGGLLFTKAIDLPGGGREFAVRGVSLITDAGALRIETLGSRSSGNGRAVHFPPKSLVFYPATADREAA